MIAGSEGEFWWNNITGPRSVVSQVADALLEKTVVVLKVPSDLPWRHQMRGSIEAAFKARFTELVNIRIIDAIDDCPPGQGAGWYLLQNVATGDIRRGYRERSGKSLQDYLIRNSVLSNTIFWVKGFNPGQATEWLKFCRSYPSRSMNDGRFVLEIPTSVPVEDGKRVRVINFSDCVSNYDLQLFNSFLVDEQSIYTPQWCQYVSTVAAKLCGVDAEVSESLVQQTDFMTEDPLAGLQRVAELREFERRGQNRGSGHVLSLVRAEDPKDHYELEKRLWSAQVQVLFPVIELERVKFINTWRGAFLDTMASTEIIQFGQVLTDPLDFELGTIVHYLTKEPLIHIPDKETRERISFLHKCRNLIAHAKCCPPEYVNRLFNGHIKFSK